MPGHRTNKTIMQWVLVNNASTLSAYSASVNTLHRVSEKTSTHIICYKLRNSCLILIIFDTKIPHNLTSFDSLVVNLT